MIRPININLNAAHPELPLVEATTFTGAPSSVFIRGVPKAVGNWSITAVSVAVTYPDNTTTARAAVESAKGVWVATIPGTATSGRTAAGFKIMADGTDENGAAVTGYVLGFSDFSVLSFTPVPAPGGTFYLLRYFDQAPATPKEGDVAKIDGVLKFYNGSAWEPFAAPVPLDDAVTRTSANGVKSSGIWSAIWGALSALPTGFTSLYDWCVSQLAGKVSKTGDTMTGGLTVPNFTVGSRKSGPIVGTKSVAEGDGTAASGFCSHAEGAYTTATANYSHAEGTYNTADGLCSHAEGTNTSTNNESEHAQGRYNASHKASVTIGDAGNTLSSIGFGTANNNRKNAVETMQDGKTYFYGLGGYDGTNPTNATDIATAVDAKASRASPATTGNLAALDANGNPTDSQIPAANVALKGNIPYSLGTPTVIDTASSEVVEGETVYYGAATLANRTQNQVFVVVALDELRVTIPAAVSGKVRDFGLLVAVGLGEGTALAAPALVPIAPTGETITMMNADGEVPTLADGTTTSTGSTVLYFTEVADSTFLVKGEQIQGVA